MITPQDIKEKTFEKALFGGYDMAASYDVPAEILHHDASGHYETRVVTAAWTELIDTYTCPCGDTYTKSR